MENKKELGHNLTPIEQAERAAWQLRLVENMQLDTETRARLLANSRYLFDLSKGIKEPFARRNALAVYSENGGAKPEEARAA